ncbi:MAG TPA: Flp family type IVb pilin [Caulobacteraceae bacterium]
MGETQPDGRLSDAAGGRAVGGLAARLSLKRFAQDDRGTTAIEYGLIAALVFLVIVTSVTAFGNKTTTLMNTVSAAIGGAIAP